MQPEAEAATSPRRLSSKKRHETKRRRNGSISIANGLSSKLKEETFQVMMDLLSVLPSSSSSGSSSSSSSGKSMTSSTSSSVGPPCQQPPSFDTSDQIGSMIKQKTESDSSTNPSLVSRSSRRLSPGGSNYLQIGHDGQVRTVPVAHQHNVHVYPNTDMVLGCNLLRNNVNNSTEDVVEVGVPSAITPTKTHGSAAAVPPKGLSAKVSRPKRAHVDILSSFCMVAGACFYVATAFWNIDGEIGNESVALSESKYRWTYLAAMLLFLLAGASQVAFGAFEASRDLWSLFTHGTMVVAASFGVSSSILLDSNRNTAMIVQAVSVHLFAAKAMATTVIHCNDGDEEILDEEDLDSTAKDIRIWIHVADACFVIGSLTDVFLSYFQIQGTAEAPHAYAGLVSASFWLIYSLILFSVSYKALNTENDNSSETSKEGMADSSVLDIDEGDGVQGETRRPQTKISRKYHSSKDKNMGSQALLNDFSNTTITGDISIGSHSSYSSIPFDEIRSL